MKKSIEQIITQKSGSSFYYTFFFLSEKKKKAMHTVYAFCRITDDIADSLEETDEEKLVKLELWKSELVKALNNHSKFELLNNLSMVIKNFHMSTEPFFDLIEGVKIGFNKKKICDF